MSLRLSPPFTFSRKGLSLGIVVLLIWLFLYTQAEFVFGIEKAVQARNEMLFYFILFIIPFTIYNLGLTGKQEGLKSFLPFIIGFVPTLVIALIFKAFLIQASVQYYTLLLGTGLLYAFIKAYIEELVFRFALPSQIGGKLGDIASSILFGLFHFSVIIMAGISVPWFAIAWLMIMGYIWSIIRRIFQSQGIGAGLNAATGSHFAYNIVVLGLI